MGRKLAESYPNLKKLNITFSEKFDFDPILPFLLCLNYLYAAQDSDGTYFVTSFPWFSEPNPNNIGITLNFFNNAAQKNIVTISYWFVATKIKETQTVALDANAVGSTNLFFRDVVKDFLDFSKEHSLIPDPRIIISSQYSIKVISRIFNQATGLGDAEMIPSSAIAQLNYLVQLPPANPGATQIIHILGSDTTDATVNVYHFIDGTYYQTYILNVKKEFGSYQNVITTFAADPKRRHAFSIYSDKAIYVIGAVSHINLLSTSVTNDPATADSITDYGMMHFYPLHYFDCTYSFFLGSEDRRMLTSDYTKSVYVTPPRNNACIDQLPINVFRQVTGNKPSIVHLQNFVASTMTLTPNNQGGTSSLLSYTPWIRFGGLRGTTADTLDQLFSAFLHYVPETSQFVTGSVNLATFSPNSIIEVYADSTVTSTSFYLDGLFVDGTMFKSSSKIAFFDGKYNVFTILVKNAGFHVLRVAGTGTYVAYVMGDNVKDLTGSYGYVAGYNINKLAVYNTGPGTQKPPVTTTKGSSMAERSLLTILFASILLNV
uniref:IgGFc_binding domain-containing protein n=1 Tax=Rhabditophanes sp. KR3021 TaxID=114890 RepID=A0AC35TXP0_9BILA